MIFPAAPNLKPGLLNHDAEFINIEVSLFAYTDSYTGQVVAKNNIDS